MNSSRDKEYFHLQEPYLEEYDEDEEDDWKDNMSPEEKYQSEITQEEKRQKEEIFGTLL